MIIQRRKKKIIVQRRKKKIIIKRREIPPELLILPKEKSGTYWDRVEGGEIRCYVCNRKFKEKDKGNKIFVGYHKFTGEKLIRHRKCLAGSVQWKKKFLNCFNDNLEPVNDKKIIIVKRRKING